jgi:hypothetical protein
LRKRAGRQQKREADKSHDFSGKHILSRIFIFVICSLASGYHSTLDTGWRLPGASCRTDEVNGPAALEESRSEIRTRLVGCSQTVPDAWKNGHILHTVISSRNWSCWGRSILAPRGNCMTSTAGPISEERNCDSLNWIAARQDELSEDDLVTLATCDPSVFRMAQELGFQPAQGPHQTAGLLLGL